MKKQFSREAIRPTDAELDILNVLWRLGPSTVRQAHEELAQLKAWQYATTLKLMQIMAGKGLLDRDESARSHVYRPLIERKDTQCQLVVRLIDRVFEGSVGSLLLGALDARPASKKELDQLRQLIDERANGRKR
jgi:BlaI family transcriptional regulator, penicillinase repressor